MDDGKPIIVRSRARRPPPSHAAHGRPASASFVGLGVLVGEGDTPTMAAAERPAML